MNADRAFEVGDRVVFRGDDTVFEVTTVNHGHLPTYDLRWENQGFKDIGNVPGFLLKTPPLPAPEPFKVYVGRVTGEKVVVLRVEGDRVYLINPSENDTTDLPLEVFWEYLREAD